MDGSKQTEREADRHWSVNDFSDEYVEWCEENEVEPTHEGEDEYLRERAEDRDYDAYRERDLW